MQVSIIKSLHSIPASDTYGSEYLATETNFNVRKRSVERQSSASFFDYLTHITELLKFSIYDLRYKYLFIPVMPSMHLYLSISS